MDAACHYEEKNHGAKVVDIGEVEDLDGFLVVVDCFLNW